MKQQHRTYNVTIGKVDSTGKDNPPRKSKDAPTEGVEMNVGDVHLKVDKVHGQVIGMVVVNGDMHFG